MSGRKQGESRLNMPKVVAGKRKARTIRIGITSRINNGHGHTHRRSNKRYGSNNTMATAIAIATAT